MCGGGGDRGMHLEKFADQGVNFQNLSFWTLWIYSAKLISDSCIMELIEINYPDFFIQPSIWENFMLMY